MYVQCVLYTVKMKRFKKLFKKLFSEILCEYYESSENTGRTQRKNGLQDRSYGVAYLIPRELFTHLNSTGTAICNITVEICRACQGEVSWQDQSLGA